MMIKDLIYIHIDNQTKIDIEEKTIITKSNIKYIQHFYNAKKLRRADKKDNYDYFHYFSNSCYLTTTLDKFYQFFAKK